jgi:hypothetical protein
MFCTKCGQQLEDNAKFCFKCGNPLTGVVQTGGVQTVPITNLSLIPPQPAAQYVQPQRGNLLIAMIILSVFTIVSSGIAVMDQSWFDYIFYHLADWFSAILVAIALAQGYIYRSSVLKTSAFIALALRGIYFVSYYSNKINYDELGIVYQIISVTYFIQTVVFLVSAIQLLRKNAVNRK